MKPDIIRKFLRAALAVSLLFSSACIQSNSKVVTQYTFQCRALENGSYEGGLRYRYKYRIFLDEQVVVSETSMSRYTKCSVFDYDNWSCEYSGSKETFGMFGGEFTPVGVWLFDKKYFSLNVSQYRYWFYEVLWMFNQDIHSQYCNSEMKFLKQTGILDFIDTLTELDTPKR